MADSKLSKSPVTEYRVLLDLLEKGRIRFQVPRDNEWEDLILEEMDQCWFDMSAAERDTLEIELDNFHR